MFLRQDARYSKEAGLHDGIDTLAYARVCGDMISTNDIKLELFFSNMLLENFRQAIPHPIGRNLRIEHKSATGSGFFQHIVAHQEGGCVGSLAYEVVMRENDVRKIDVSGAGYH